AVGNFAGRPLLAGSRGSQCSGRKQTMEILSKSANGCFATPAPTGSRRPRAVLETTRLSVRNRRIAAVAVDGSNWRFRPVAVLRRSLKRPFKIGNAAVNTVTGQALSGAPPGPQQRRVCDDENRAELTSLG